MEEGVRRLEQARQAVQTAQWWAGYIGDFLDHGNPDDAQAREAAASMLEYRRWEADARQALHDLLVKFRETSPHDIAAWVGWHAGICERIIAAENASAAGRDSEMARAAARSLLEQWQQVLMGEREFVDICDYLLPDYVAEVSTEVSDEE